MSKGRSVGYWSNITAIYEKQREKGIDTYGQTLEENQELTMEQRIEMLEEELVDGLMYLEHLKDSIRKLKESIKHDNN